MSLNLYAYCNNNPLMYLDPDGHKVVGKNKKVIKKTTTSASRKAVAASKKSASSSSSSAKSSKSNSSSSNGSSSGSSSSTIPGWLDWDQNGVVDSKADKQSFDSNNDKIADWNQESTKANWTHSNTSGWIKNSQIIAPSDDLYVTAITGSSAIVNYSSSGAENAYTFVGVIYLNSSDGAGGFGHAAIMLVTDGGRGIIYSFSSATTLEVKASDFLGESNPGKLLKFINKEKEYATVDVKRFLETGEIYLEKFTPEGKNYRYLDIYERYIYMPVTNEEGQAMYEKAEALREDPPDYNLYSNNCNHISQQILSAADLDFAPLTGTSLDEKITISTLIGPGGVQRLIENLVVDWDNKTIPNAAYKYGDRIAGKNGWHAGNIGDGWNPFK